jgi:hypothetical protein
MARSIVGYPTIFDRARSAIAVRNVDGATLRSPDGHREGVEVMLRVHLVIAERNGLAGEERWEGFIFFETGKPKPLSWAFVVDAVEEASSPRRARRNRRGDGETVTSQQEIG